MERNCIHTLIWQSRSYSNWTQSSLRNKISEIPPSVCFSFKLLNIYENWNEFLVTVLETTLYCRVEKQSSIWDSHHKSYISMEIFTCEYGPMSDELWTQNMKLVSKPNTLSFLIVASTVNVSVIHVTANGACISIIVTVWLRSLSRSTYSWIIDARVGSSNMIMSSSAWCCVPSLCFWLTCSHMMKHPPPIPIIMPIQLC